jgi:hypothetical protein
MNGSKVREGLLQVSDQLSNFARLYHNVGDVDLEVVADLLMEAFLHAPLEGRPSVPQVERH